MHYQSTTNAIVHVSLDSAFGVSVVPLPMLLYGVLQAGAMTTAAAQQAGGQGDRLSVEDALVLMQQAVRKGQLQEVCVRCCPLVQQ